jgi:hypothetical protein
MRAPSPADIEALIYRRLAYMPLDPAGVAEFAAEYARRYGVLSMSVHFRETFGGLLATEAVLPLLPVERSQRLFTFERRLVSSFLRSTDYFRRDAGDGRSVRYVAFADPYELPCNHPFAVRS